MHSLSHTTSRVLPNRRAACVGGSGAPVPDLSGPQESLSCPGSGAVPRNLGRVRCWAKFDSPPEEILGRRYVPPVVITAYLVRLIMESHRGDLFPASCSMFVSTVS